ncbi:MAG: histidine phosphatase family protein, partial [Pseudomonadota bacterium]
MKTLYLLRHAKSSWSDATLSDRLRPLNKRGRNAASQVGRFVHSRGLVPDLVLCSPATRTRETLQRMADEWDAAPPVRYEEGLYEFSAGSSYLSLVRAAPADVGSLMLIGHNPT